MRYEAWAPTEAAIRAQFGYDAATDLLAARELRALVPVTSRYRNLGVAVRNRRNVAVIGAGPSLDRIPGPAALLEGKVVIAADGACSWLRKHGILPSLVVTDLDGNPDDLAWAAQAGAFMVAHAHGDNRAAISKLAPQLGPQLYGSYQGPPLPELAPMENFGGFTDGDRAVVLCEHLGARQVTLLGFDFQESPSDYSHKWDPATKPAKLAWAERIIGEVQGRGSCAVVRYVPSPA